MLWEVLCLYAACKSHREIDRQRRKRERERWGEKESGDFVQRFVSNIIVSIDEIRHSYDSFDSIVHWQKKIRCITLQFHIHTSMHITFSNLPKSPIFFKSLYSFTLHQRSFPCVVFHLSSILSSTSLYSLEYYAFWLFPSHFLQLQIVLHLCAQFHSCSLFSHTIFWRARVCVLSIGSHIFHLFYICDHNDLVRLACSKC